MSSNDQSSPDQTPNNDQQPSSFMQNLLSGKTPAVKNMEAAWTRAGAGANHTPGHASKLGSQEQPAKNGSGVGSDEFEKTIGDQRSEPSVVGKFVNQMLNGSDRGK